MAEIRFQFDDKVQHKVTKQKGVVIGLGARSHYGEDTYAVEWILNASRQLTTLERGVPASVLEPSES